MKSKLKKFAAVLSVAMATPQFATADEALYKDYLSQHKDASLCIGIGDILESDYLEEMIEAVGEDAAIRVMDIHSASTTRAIANIVAALSDDNLNKIWKQRFENNNLEIASDAQDQGWEHARNSVKVLGIEKATENYIENCE